jgi:hypothetical protein
LQNALAHDLPPPPFGEYVRRSLNVNRALRFKTVEEILIGDGKSSNSFAVFALTFYGGCGSIFTVVFMVTLILLHAKCHARLQLHGADGATDVAMEHHTNATRRLPQSWVVSSTARSEPRRESDSITSSVKLYQEIVETQAGVRRRKHDIKEYVSLYILNVHRT